MTSNSNKLLINEPPLQVLPTLAVAVGLNEAIVLQQLHYWLSIAEKSNSQDKFINGRWWTYNTYEHWKNNFPFWSIMTIRRIIYSLEKTGLIVSRQMRSNKYDATKWYSIDYDKLDDLIDMFKLNTLPSSERTEQSSQEEQLLIPETSTEITSETYLNINEQMQESSRIIMSSDVESLEEKLGFIKEEQDKPFDTTPEAIKAIQEVAHKYPNRIVGARRPTDQVISDGIKLVYDIKQEYEDAFHVFVKWEGRDGRSFLKWLKERPPDQTLGMFSSWWKT
jgi:hypothetical protein